MQIQRQVWDQIRGGLRHKTHARDNFIWGFSFFSLPCQPPGLFSASCGRTCPELDWRKKAFLFENRLSLGCSAVSELLHLLTARGIKF